jgi:hypothetical protein
MSDITLSGTYKGYQIEYRSWCSGEPFACYSLNLYAPTWESMQTKIDKAVKVTTKRIAVFVIGSGVVRGEITSLCDEGDVSGFGDKFRRAWVVTNEGKRRKESLDRMILDTQGNIEALRLANVEETQADEHNAKCKAIIDAIPRVQVSDIMQTKVAK